MQQLKSDLPNVLIKVTMSLQTFLISFKVNFAFFFFTADIMFLILIILLCILLGA